MNEKDRRRLYVVDFFLRKIYSKKVYKKSLRILKDHILYPPSMIKLDTNYGTKFTEIQLLLGGFLASIYRPTGQKSNLSSTG